MLAKLPLRGVALVRFSVQTTLLAVLVAITAGPASAQKAPWEITNVETSGKALSPKASVDSVFGGDGKELKVFLYVTVKYNAAPGMNSITQARILDRKKKVVGQLFNYTVDKGDKKMVTLIFQNNEAWADVDDLHLRASGQTFQLGKR